MGALSLKEGVQFFVSCCVALVLLVSAAVITVCRSIMKRDSVKMPASRGKKIYPVVALSFDGFTTSRFRSGVYRDRSGCGKNDSESGSFWSSFGGSSRPARIS